METIDVLRERQTSLLVKRERQPAPAARPFADHQGAAGPEHAAAQGLGSSTLRYAAGPLEDDGFAVNFCFGGCQSSLQQMPNANLDKLHRGPYSVPYSF